MNAKTHEIQWLLLLVLGCLLWGTSWLTGSASLASPLFQSPLPTPDWSGLQTTPTPRPHPTVVPTVGPATLTTGLKGYWKLDEATTGNRADSSSLGSNTLSNVNGVGWKTGHTGKASDFEKDAGQYLKIESYEAIGLNLSHSFTLVGWVKRESINNYMTFVAKYRYGTSINKRAYRFGVDSDNRLLLVISPNGSYSSNYQVTGGSRLTSTGSWYHVAAVFDADAKRLKLYLNGNLDADKSVTCNTIYQTDAQFMLGAIQGDNPAHYFDGLLDEWRVYNRALSQSEVQTLRSLL